MQSKHKEVNLILDKYYNDFYQKEKIIEIIDPIYRDLKSLTKDQLIFFIIELAQKYEIEG